MIDAGMEDEIEKRMDLAIHALSEFCDNIIIITDHSKDCGGTCTHAKWFGNVNAAEGLALGAVRDGLITYEEFIIKEDGDDEGEAEKK